jgi:hypothetical protein
MATMRQSWTDERLDDMREDIDRRFARVEADIAALCTEMREGFDRIDRRFDSLYRLLLGLGATLVAALLAGHL